jgi:hypothetical protein
MLRGVIPPEGVVPTSATGFVSSALMEKTEMEPSGAGTVAGRLETSKNLPLGDKRISAAVELVEASAGRVETADPSSLRLRPSAL